MRRAEITLEGASLFREATDPEVDLVDAGDRETVFAGRPVAMSTQEVRRVSRDVCHLDRTETRGFAEAGIDRDRRDKVTCGRTAILEGAGLARAVVTRNAVRTGHAGVRAVSRDEVHEALRVSEVVRVVEPAHVGLKRRITGVGVEHSTSTVQ